MKKIFLIIGMLVVLALIIVGLFYFGVFKLPEIPKMSVQEQYTHPTIGFTFKYPKILNLETPVLPATSECPTEPCFIILKNPSYNNEIVNWLFVVPIAYMGGDKTKVQAGLDDDVSKGFATVTTINGTKMNKYTNDPKKPVETLLALYKTMGIDSSKEQSLYMFIVDESAVMLGFRNSPTGVPAKYKDYLDVQSWKNPTAAK